MPSETARAIPFLQHVEPPLPASWKLRTSAIGWVGSLAAVSNEAAYAALCLLLSVYRRVAMPDIRALHLNRLPQGPKILAPNHAYMSDAFALPSLVPGRLAFLIQAEAFALPIVGRWLSASGQIPVDPARPSRSLLEGLLRLRRGRSVVIFPEGRLNHGGNVGRVCSGAIRLGLRSGVPIIPVGLHVPRRFVRILHGRYGGRQTRGGWQLGGVCTVAFGDAWVPFPNPDVHPSRQALRAAADELRDRIEALWIEAQLERGSCGSPW